MNQQLPPHKDVTTVNGIDYFYNLTQGSEEWHHLRYGMLTASNMDKILTPTLKVASNANTRAFIYEMAAQRLVNLPVDNFVSYDMERGKLEEIEARIKYNELNKDAPAKECGFVINKDLGFAVGMSPDGLVDQNGTIEVKSRKAKFQVQTILEHMVEAATTPIPNEFMLQVQSNLFVTKREWCDFISYSNGFNMAVIRCKPIQKYQDAIAEALTLAEQQITSIVNDVHEKMINDPSIVKVNWINHHEEIQA